MRGPAPTRPAGRRRRLTPAVIGGVVALSLCGPLGNAVASAAGLLPPANPQADIPPVPTFLSAASCAATPSGPACAAQLLAAIDAAQAAEDVGPMALPTDYFTLSVPEQLFVLADLERVDRGLPPYLGMVATLDAVAQAAAAADQDPLPPAGFPTAASSGYPLFGGAWAGGPGQALGADYLWMYDDGWDGSDTRNLSCTSSTAPACWAHRDELLGSDPGFDPGVGLACTDCVMGTGYAMTAGGTSYADLVVAPTGPPPPLAFSWSADVLPYLAVPPGSRVVGMADSGGNGAWTVSADGVVTTLGHATSYGDPASMALNEPIVGIAATPERGSKRGYWLVAADGGVFAYGTAKFFGSMGGQPLDAPIVSIAATPDGGGYWLVAADGGIFAFGDARFWGSMGGKPLNEPVVGMTADSATGGYWLVAADGGIFAFNAPFHGSTGTRVLNRPIVGIEATTGGGGYRFVAADGGVFCFTTPFGGSLGTRPPPDGVSGIAATGTTGYWIVEADGAVHSFGDAPDL